MGLLIVLLESHVIMKNPWNCNIYFRKVNQAYMSRNLLNSLAQSFLHARATSANDWFDWLMDEDSSESGNRKVLMLAFPAQILTLMSLPE